MRKAKANIGYKVTRPDGTDFYTGTVDYAAALQGGAPLVHADPQGVTGQVCGRGFHVSPTPQLAIGFADGEKRPWRYFEIEYLKESVIESDNKKLRLSRIEQVRAELSLKDIFGADFADRIAAVKKQTEGWKSIAWLKPKKPIKPAAIEKLFGEWHSALGEWLPKGRKMAAKIRIVTAAAAAADAAAAAAAAADAAAADAAAAAADAAAADAAAADAAAAAADAADAAAAAADAAAADAWHYRYRRWYVRPYYVLRRHARWQIAGMKQPNPFKPLAEMFALGAMPIGYVKGEFVVWCPPGYFFVNRSPGSDFRDRVLAVIPYQGDGFEQSRQSEITHAFDQMSGGIEPR